MIENKSLNLNWFFLLGFSFRQTPEIHWWLNVRRQSNNTLGTRIIKQRIFRQILKRFLRVGHVCGTYTLR